MPGMLRAVLSQNLKGHRERLGLTQEGMAHKAGLTVGYVSNVERMKSAASIDVIERLAAALEVEPGELLLRQPVPEAKRAKRASKR
jgi:transcriptional regulator with XRE-family HTH domain